MRRPHFLLHRVAVSVSLLRTPPFISQTLSFALPRAMSLSPPFPLLINRLFCSQAANGDLERMAGTVETIMRNEQKILSVALTRGGGKPKTSLTVYRKGNVILRDKQPRGYPRFEEGNWSPLFQDCLVGAWIFGYSFAVSSLNER